MSDEQAPLVGRVRGWRKVLALVFLVAVGVCAEMFFKNGLSANLKELLIYCGGSYLIGQGISSGMGAWNK